MRREFVAAVKDNQAHENEGNSEAGSDGSLIMDEALDAMLDGEMEGEVRT